MCTYVWVFYWMYLIDLIWVVICADVLGVIFEVSCLLYDCFESILVSIMICWKYYVDYNLGIGVYMSCECCWGVLSIIPMLIYAHGFDRYCWRYHTDLYLCYECVWCVQIGGLCRLYICCVCMCTRCMVGSIRMILPMLNVECWVSTLCYWLYNPVN